MIVYIYGLVDQRDKRVRYVGKSITPSARLYAHLSAKGINPIKDAWLDELKSQGLKPELKIIDKCKAYEWQFREMFWIKEYRKKENDLTNLADGGMSGFSSISTPKKECYACLGGRRYKDSLCNHCDANTEKIVYSKADLQLAKEIREFYP